MAQLKKLLDDLLLYLFHHLSCTQHPAPLKEAENADNLVSGGVARSLPPNKTAHHSNKMEEEETKSEEAPHKKLQSTPLESKNSRKIDCGGNSLKESKGNSDKLKPPKKKI